MDVPANLKLDLTGVRVLLVEDNELNCDMIQRRLGRRGCEVLVAQTARDAVARARDEHPQVILMDLQLPDMSGWDLARLFKTDAKTSDIPLIALTAHAM